MHLECHGNSPLPIFKKFKALYVGCESGTLENKLKPMMKILCIPG